MVKLERLGASATQRVLTRVQRFDDATASVACAQLCVCFQLTAEFTLPLDVKRVAELLQAVESRKRAVVELLRRAATTQAGGAVREALLTAVVVTSKP